MNLNEINQLEKEILEIYPRLKAYAIKLTKNNDLAEELLHDTILKVLDAPEKFREANSLIAMTIQRLRWDYFDMIKKKSPNPFNEVSNDIQNYDANPQKTSKLDKDTILNETLWGETIMDTEKQSFTELIYSKCLNQLSKMSLEIFQMNLIDKKVMTTKKIGHVLKLSQSKVLKILAQAKNEIRNCIKREYQI